MSRLWPTDQQSASDVAISHCVISNIRKELDEVKQSRSRDGPSYITRTFSPQTETSSRAIITKANSCFHSFGRCLVNNTGVHVCSIRYLDETKLTPGFVHTNYVSSTKQAIVQDKSKYGQPPTAKITFLDYRSPSGLGTRYCPTRRVFLDEVGR